MTRTGHGRLAWVLTAKQDKKGSSGPGSPVADACFFSLSQAIVKGYLVIFRFPKKKVLLLPRINCLKIQLLHILISVKAVFF